MRKFLDVFTVILVIFTILFIIYYTYIAIYEFIDSIPTYEHIYSYVDIYGEEKVVDYCCTHYGTFYCEDNGRKFYVDNYKYYSKEK